VVRIGGYSDEAEFTNVCFIDVCHQVEQD